MFLWSIPGGLPNGSILCSQQPQRERHVVVKMQYIS